MEAPLAAALSIRGASVSVRRPTLRELIAFEDERRRLGDAAAIATFVDAVATIEGGAAPSAALTVDECVRVANAATDTSGAEVPTPASSAHGSGL